MKRIIIMLAVLGALTVIPAPAQAHVSEGRSWWYWQLLTTKGPQDLDPIMIVWTHGTLAPDTSHSAVKDVVNGYWWRYRPAHRRFMFGQDCLGQGKLARKISDSGIQYVRFWYDYYDSSYFSDDTDFQGSTSNRCLSQWHMRFWDDYEHARDTKAHGREQQWVISGVHRDISTGSFAFCVPGFPVPDCRRYGTGHRITARWVPYRNYAVNRALSALCGRARWRQFPGADRKHRGQRMDGYISRIDFQGDAGGCPHKLY